MTLNNNHDKLPGKPGVYIFKDMAEKILYVGKAKNLKKRVKSYFREELDSDKTRIMMKQFHSMEYIVTDTEKEALILESNLIKKYLPRYNIRLKDDKRYPYVKITREDFPRVIITRRVKDDNSYYYGPFTDVTALRSMVRFIKALFRIRDCKNMDGPCLNSQMDLCEAPCNGQITKNEYNKLIDKANLFFQGKYSEIMTIQKTNMEEASKNHEFERAAILRDQIASIKGMVERQKMEFNRRLEQDVIACSLDEEFASVVLFRVRSGKIIGKEEFLMSAEGGVNTPEGVLSAFLKQYYSGPQQVPSELVLQYHVDEEELILDWLREKSEGDVSIRVPEEGLEYRLVKMVAKNADIARNQQEQVKGALLEVQDYLGIPKIPRYIEAFDISNISGKLAVGSMVVFEDGAPKKSNYRRYRVETEGPDDYGMMREVLTRRYQKLAGDRKDEPRPDLILIDGGKGQLNTALQVLKSLNISGIPIIGLAKEFEHIFIPNFQTPIILPRNSKALHLLMRVRDEAHRFAVTYHKKLRSMEMNESILDQIPGVGPKRKLRLIRHFGSIKHLQGASAEEIAQVEGISQNLAEFIHQKLQIEVDHGN